MVDGSRAVLFNKPIILLFDIDDEMKDKIK